jgi:hypothetical protein
MPNKHHPAPTHIGKDDNIRKATNIYCGRVEYMSDIIKTIVLILYMPIDGKEDDRTTKC